MESNAFDKASNIILVENHSSLPLERLYATFPYAIISDSMSQSNYEVIFAENGFIYLNDSEIDEYMIAGYQYVEYPRTELSLPSDIDGRQYKIRPYAFYRSSLNNY